MTQKFVPLTTLLETLTTQFIWFGLLEEREKSMELFNYQINHQNATFGEYFKLPKLNYNKFKNYNHKKKVVDESTRAQIRKLMPLDTILYEYAEKLFKDRYECYKKGICNETKIPSCAEKLASFDQG